MQQSSLYCYQNWTRHISDFMTWQTFGRHGQIHRNHKQITIISCKYLFHFPHSDKEANMCDILRIHLPNKREKKMPRISSKIMIIHLWASQKCKSAVTFVSDHFMVPQALEIVWHQTRHRITNDANGGRRCLRCTPESQVKSLTEVWVAQYKNKKTRYKHAFLNWLFTVTCGYWDRHTARAHILVDHVHSASVS